jgi:hypothetical protein
VSKKQVKEYVAETRAELSATLDEIEHRLSPVELSKKTAHWVSGSFDRNPAAWLVAGGAVVVGAVAAVLWAVFGDD